MATKILVADDDRAIRTVIKEALGRLGYDVRVTADGATLWRWIKDGEGDLVVTDVVLPDENGLDLIPRIEKLRPDLKVIAMSARNTLLTAVKAAERGAFEYLPKPFDLKELIAVVERALLPGRGASAPSREEEIEEQPPLIGRSPAMQEVYRLLARLVRTDLTVLIIGESGTGKELVARALHQYGKRSSGPFVAINMAAIPRELIESELFGHEKGAFTGATARGLGRFEQAQGGTLFLDEIGDMPMEAQTRLLRVLQEGEFTTVGGRRPIRADVRILAATHHDLARLIGEGSFREDLYYRLNVAPIRLPPLRERRQDIPSLVRHFALQAAREGLPLKRFDDGAMERLSRHRWPGNVRELENLVRRLAALYAQEEIAADAVEAELEGAPVSAEAAAAAKRGSIGETGGEERGQTGQEREAAAGEGLSASVERHLKGYFAAHRGGLPASGLYERVLREIERPLIALTLGATRGNQLKAADVLGLNRNTLRKKIRELDIRVVRGLK